ncbi:hypothetical protein [Paraburkholderia sp. RAU2J]|uniref:hypothetical protein n=1 Tax=Paraburkholderia sp. RAU2J TaxID=1938810 RepID=UPI000EAE118C|nr:hypothetical protein [Paraburkholderia sp. RAU2J]
MLAYASSLDCIGGFANDVRDLAALYSVLDDNASDERESRLRVGILSGYFETYASQQARDAVLETASLFGPNESIDMSEDDMQLGRGAATIVSNVEVATAHANLLDAPEYTVSPRLRTRLLGGALSPAAWYARALS